MIWHQFENLNSGGTLCNWTVQVTFNTGVYDFELWGQDAHMVTQVRALRTDSTSYATSRLWEDEFSLTSGPLKDKNSLSPD